MKMQENLRAHQRVDYLVPTVHLPILADQIVLQQRTVLQADPVHTEIPDRNGKPRLLSDQTFWAENEVADPTSIDVRSHAKVIIRTLQHALADKIQHHQIPFAQAVCITAIPGMPDFGSAQVNFFPRRFAAESQDSRLSQVQHLNGSGASIPDDLAQMYPLQIRGVPIERLIKKMDQRLGTEIVLQFLR